MPPNFKIWGIPILLSIDFILLCVLDSPTVKEFLKTFKR
jgi:hypothetical protein